MSFYMNHYHNEGLLQITTPDRDMYLWIDPDVELTISGMTRGHGRHPVSWKMTPQEATPVSLEAAAECAHTWDDGWRYSPPREMVWVPLSEFAL